MHACHNVRGQICRSRSAAYNGPNYKPICLNRRFVLPPISVPDEVSKCAAPTAPTRVLPGFPQYITAASAGILVQRQRLLVLGNASLSRWLPWQSYILLYYNIYSLLYRNQLLLLSTPRLGKSWLSTMHPLNRQIMQAYARPCYSYKHILYTSKS